MTLTEVLSLLAPLGEEKVRQMNQRNGATGPQFGVRMGDIRKVAKKIKTDHALALQLWETGNLDARFLAVLVMKPDALTTAELDTLVRSNDFPALADWLSSYVIKQHPEKEALRQAWMQDSHPFAARAGWSLTTERILKSPDGLDLGALLDRIEAEMPGAPRAAQWTMNFALAHIGIHHPAHRARAIAIGEQLGIFRDYPTSKGCTSPFAPFWINEMVRRQDAAA
jgi:3-methyladenine DNA glycosylase AlkD